MNKDDIRKNRILEGPRANFEVNIIEHKKWPSGRSKKITAEYNYSKHYPRIKQWENYQEKGIPDEWYFSGSARDKRRKKF